MPGNELLPEQRHHAACPIELTAAVEQALAQGKEHPLQGVSDQDWEQVLFARKTEAEWSLAKLTKMP